MDQPTISTVTLAERITRVEERQRHDREFQSHLVSSLTLRVELLEAHRHTMIQIPGPNGVAWLKIALAILLPLSVLLMTGSADKAMRAAAMMRGMP